MIVMDKVHSIRQLFYEQGKSVSAIAAETGHDRKTICKYLDMTDFNTPEPKKEDPENMCPKLDAYKPLIDQWLLDDRKAPRKRKRKIASTLIFCVYHETGNSICQEQVDATDTAGPTNELWSLQWCHFYGPNMGAIYRKYQERGGKPVFQTIQLQFYHNILTASNEDQAEGYRMQIEQRKDYLPTATHFAVIPDEGGVRVGSGGATLSVIRYIYEQEKIRCGHGHFDNLRILVIHSGGDSKRVPTYSALGKLFSPVPHKLPDGRSSTLFDEFLIVMSSVPARIREGMLLLSGDVLLLFNPLQIDFSGRGAAAISFKENVETGKNHGVFLNGENNTVRKFLHKQTVETLTQAGAVNENHCVDIDTGAVIFSVEVLDALYSLIRTDKLYNKYVNNMVRLSLYGDFLYPLAEDSTLESYYQEKPEGAYTTELHDARSVVWETLRPFRLKPLRLAPAKFIHFGTTREILALMSGGTKEYEALSWSDKVNSSIDGDTAGYNSVLSGKAQIGEKCYLEVSYVHSKATVGSHVLLSYIDVHDETIPDNVVLHGLKQKDGRFVCRIYGVEDNPKETKIFGQELSEIVGRLGIADSDLWDTDDHTLWMAKLYPECDTVKEAVAAALNVYDLVHGSGDIESWKNTDRKSLCSGFGDADPAAIIAWNQRMRELVRMDEIAKDIRSGKPARETGKLAPLTRIQQEWLAKRYTRRIFQRSSG